MNDRNNTISSIDSTSFKIDQDSLKLKFSSPLIEIGVEEGIHETTESKYSVKVVHEVVDLPSEFVMFFTESLLLFIFTLTILLLSIFKIISVHYFIALIITFASFILLLISLLGIRIFRDKLTKC